MSKTQVTQEELAKIQQLNADFNKAKMEIADVELQKLNIIRHIEEIKAQFSIFEKVSIG